MHVAGDQLTPHIEVIDIGDGFLLFDDRARAQDMPKWLATKEDVAQYVSEHSTEDEFYAVGDWLKGVLSKLGIDKPCLPCAQRQAKLNRVFSRRSNDNSDKQVRKRQRDARKKQR